MKLSLFLKTVSALGLVAVLSVAVYSNIKQPAQAQSQDKVEAEILSEEDPSTLTCIEAATGSEAGSETISFDQFQGIEFTPEQEAEYRRIKKEDDERGELIAQGLERRVRPDWSMSFVPNEGVTIPDDILQEIDKAYTAAVVDEISDVEQVDALNAKYSEYVEFMPGEEYIFTPEQAAANEARTLIVQGGMLSVMRPEQQKTYLENIEIQRSIAACDN